MSKKRGLGKGLGALIATEEITYDKNTVMEVDINTVEPNENQPRKNFDQESLEELSKSIEEFGIIQPLIVNDREDYYEIVAGERRWRAARMAKLRTVPVIIKDYDEMETLQIALIENIQREDLNPIEEALCYNQLMDVFFYTMEDIGERIGKSRNTISSTLSLLKLDLRVQNLIIDDNLALGHGRNLLKIKNSDLQYETALKILEEDLSLKQGKNLIDRVLNPEKEKKYIPKQYKDLENRLKGILGTKVNIKDGKNKGKIEIEYYSEDELDRIIGIINLHNQEVY